MHNPTSIVCLARILRPFLIVSGWTKTEIYQKNFSKYPKKISLIYNLTWINRKAKYGK
jgi:hypothetical protein